MNLDGYLMQILVVIGKGCRPNSPYPDRVWMSLKPYDGIRIPDLGKARIALVRAGLVDSAWGSGWKVKPSRLGYILIEKWKEHRRALRARPILYGQVVKEFRGLDQRLDRFAA